MEIDKAKLSVAVVKLQSGDMDAFNEVYSLTNQSAYFTALKITKNEEDAQDVLQNAYIKLLDKISSLDKPESFMSWFNMMVANESRNLMKKNHADLFTDNVLSGGKEDEEYSVFDTIEDDTESFTPGLDIEQDELQREVMALIDSLSDEKRTAVTLFYYNEMTTKQIAEALEINENTVKSRLVQAKKDLAKGIKELEKKRKLLGIAPMSVVRWAFNVQGESTPNRSMQDMQELFAKFQNSNAHTGLSLLERIRFNLSELLNSISSKISSTNDKGIDLRPVAAVVVAAGVVGGAVAGSSAVRNRDVKDETTAVTQVVQTTVQNFTRSTPKERYGDVTVPEGRDTDVLFSKEKAKYGVEIAYQDYAVANGDGTGFVESKPIFSRNGFSATYEDLLPAANENGQNYSSQASEVLSGINSLREEKGLKDLNVNSVLTEQANVRAEEIAWSGRDNAIRPDGTYYTTVFEHNGFSDGTRIEVISANRTSVSAAIKELTKNNAISSSEVDEIGVGVAKDPETDRFVFVVHLYSHEKSLLGNFPLLRDYLKSGRDDFIYGIADNITDYERLERAEEAVAKIPVVGDILLYDFDNDTQLMEFDKAMERLADRINALADSIEEE